MNSDNITIMSEGRDNPDVSQGDTVYSRAAEKNTVFWNISAIYRGWLYSLGTRSAAVIWKGSQALTNQIVKEIKYFVQFQLH